MKSEQEFISLKETGISVSGNCMYKGKEVSSGPKVCSVPYENKAQLGRDPKEDRARSCRALGTMLRCWDVVWEQS